MNRHLIEHIRSFWIQILDSSPNQTASDIAQTDYLSARFLEMNGVSFIDFNTKLGSINYLSDNIEQIYGLSKANFQKEGIFHLFKHLIASQSTYAKAITSLLEQIFTTWTSEELLSAQVCIVGLRIQEDSGHSTAFINNVRHVELTESNLPARVVFMLRDISPLLKDENYWIRIHNNSNPSKIVFYHSNKNLKFSNDILSKREKEILALMVEGKTTENLMELLDISRNTINNHRQNLLDKLSVRDTTALITLANMIDFNLYDHHE